LDRLSGSARRIALTGALAASAGLLGLASPVAAAPAQPSANVEAVCPPASRGTAECLALRRTDIGIRPATSGAPLTSAPPGFGPADIQSAYALPTGAVGAGMTVAIVDAYDLPTAEADLGVYRSQYGLPACTTANGCFRKVDQNGGTNYPIADSGWGLEIALDLDMVSAACPACNILLVEATSPTYGDLGQSVDTAVSLGAVVVSNSYGGPEDPGETSIDSHYNHPGVAITVATGDCGYDVSSCYPGLVTGVEYPAASQYVVAVGGTTLTRDSSTRTWTETAWGHSGKGAGSGCSAYEAKPSWQHDSGCPNRTVGDVSAVADPSTGVAVYTGGVWGVYGGTSAATPIVAGVYALGGPPAAGTYPASYPYSATGSLYDAVGGNNNVTGQICTVTLLCNGVAGYDGPTGLGTPNGTAAFAAPRSTYHALTPTRILDTRDGTGGLSGKFSAYVARTFQVTGSGGVPIGASAVTGNLTVTGQSAAGFLFIGPVATNNPSSSTLNFPLGDNRANAVTVALGAGGTLSVTYVAGSLGATTHVIFDVTGYFMSAASDPTGAKYHPLAPTRILDSRDGTGGLSGTFSAYVARTFQVTGAGGVPVGAVAVTGNLTVTQQSAAGYLFMGPIAANNPTSSTLNFPVGDNRANAATVALGTGGALGTLSITYVAGPANATTHVVFDVTGYFMPAASDPTGAKYLPLNPTRILDSRDGTGGLSGKFTAYVARTFQVAGAGGVSGNATAVTGNLTVTQQSAAGYLFIGPVATNNPGSSTLNFPVGDNRANAVTVALGTGGALGTLSITYVAGPTSATTHVVFDVTGIFAP
jgi:hypothetical protein